MGGPMSYQRMRGRNGLLFRKPDDDPDPYWRGESPFSDDDGLLVGDLNRMERDYLADNYCAGTEHEGKCDLGQRVADETGVDVETVRKVLRYVFFEQR